MGGCTNLNSLYAQIAAEITRRGGVPYDNIIFADHGNSTNGQQFGETYIDSYENDAAKKMLAQLKGAAKLYEFRGCNTAPSWTNYFFADQTQTPVYVNEGESVSLTWGVYWPGFWGYTLIRPAPKPSRF